MDKKYIIAISKHDYRTYLGIDNDDHISVDYGDPQCRWTKIDGLATIRAMFDVTMNKLMNNKNKIPYTEEGFKQFKGKFKDVMVS